METLLTTENLVASAGPLFGPAVRPQSLSGMDVSATGLENLALKTLYLSGPLSVLDLAEKMRLSFGVVEDLFFRLRHQILCQVTGMSNNIPQLAITTQGRARATELLAHCQYVGPAPVSLENYSAQTRLQSTRGTDVRPADIARSFSRLVLEDETLRQFGAAVHSGSAIFLYGPPGAGKTASAEALSRAVAEDEIWIPYAVEVDSQIITVFDPAIHIASEDPESGVQDERWVRCRRPKVLVGGELTVEMLDLQHNPTANYYVGPVQMKANNGVLIIDDFGRQRVRPQELLNRWVVPLDRRIDFLTLIGGKKIEIPFEMLVVFASNLDPAEFLEAAFLRRIQTKIRFGAVSDEQFCEIFRRVAQEQCVECEPGISQLLIRFIRSHLNEELRACYPRDIVNHVAWAARYEGKKPYVDRTALMHAVHAYFIQKP